MQNLPVLADATIWIQYLREPRAAVNNYFERLLTEGRVRICGMILAEIMQGAKTEDELYLVRSLIEAIPYVEESRRDWEEAASLIYQLRKKGVTLALSDCLIAAIAFGRDFIVFSLDKDFERIPNLKLLRSGR